MKQQKPRKKHLFGIVFWSFFAIVSALLAIVAFLLPSDTRHEGLDDYFSTSRVSVESTVIILILMALLPLAILHLSRVLKPRKKDNVEEELEFSGILPGTATPPPAPAATPSAPASQSTVQVPGITAKPSGTLSKDKQKAETFRFKTLSEIDKKAHPAPTYDDSLTLQSLCESFRQYAASNLKLYYDISDIRKFIAALGVSPILILQGMSGTGKTSLACAFGKFVHHDAAVVPVQPMWKERSDMLGYFNEFTERFNETAFLATLYEAHYSKDMCLTVLDEMNIARVEYYFADFLSLLELPNPKDRLLTVTSETRRTDPHLLRNGKLMIPQNMWYIGTANNDDSTFAISDKVYDRAMIMNLEHKAKPFKSMPCDGVYISFAHFQDLVAEALSTHTLSDEQKAHLTELDRYLIENFHVTFGNRIMKQIERYVPLYVMCGGSETEALDDMISQKLFRKLEVLNPVYVRAAAPGLVQTLTDLFGEDAMPACHSYLKKFIDNN